MMVRKSVADFCSEIIHANIMICISGHVFSKEEKFGQYPLQVNGFGNIHESLEAATAQEIESNNLEVMTKSGQEVIIT